MRAAIRKELRAPRAGRADFEEELAALDAIGAHGVDEHLLFD